MATPNLSELATTTLDNRNKEICDNVTDNVPLLKFLQKAGNMKTVSGGLTLVEEVDYNDNGTAKWYSGYETLNISPSEVLSSFQYDWKQLAGAISISGLEQIKNSGKEAILDLLEARMINLKRSLANAMSVAVFGDGTGDGGKTLGGLQLLISDDPTTGTVGGVARATWTFARNQYYRGVTDGGAAVSASNIVSYMNQLYLRTLRGTDHVQLITADNNYFTFYEDALNARQHIIDGKGNVIDGSLKYKQAEVVCDGGVGGACPANHMYFINPDYIRLKVARDRNYAVLDPDRYATNQDAMVKIVAWAGNLTCNNFFLQGVLKA